MNCNNNLNGLCTRDPFPAKKVYVRKYTDDWVKNWNIDVTNVTHKINTIDNYMCLDIDCKFKNQPTPTKY
jgi:hypothetical protein